MRAASALALGAALGLAASLAEAAPRAAPAKSGSPDLCGGYSYTKAGEATLHGIGLSGSYPLRPALSLVVEVTGHDGSFAGADLDELGLMAGARWSPSSNRLRPFVEGLLGGVRTSVSLDVGGARISDTDSDWGLALGGGADYRLSARWSLRGLVQMRLLHGEGAWDSDPRFALGAVFRIGR